MKVAAVVLLALLLGCGSGMQQSLRTVRRTTTTLVQPGKCVEGARPDLVCTPGTHNPAVTQTTIHQTICVRGWTATVRPPVSVTSRIKVERMRAYGVAGQSPSLYELDHDVPLELGGGTADVANLWPEKYAIVDGARTKDKVENAARAAVCAGTLSLIDAQHGIAADWVAFGKIHRWI